jgi:hypothetical protein
MLTLGLALVVLGLFGLVLRGVRRLWPGSITRPRIVLLQVALVAAWVFGGNLLAEIRERSAQNAWRAVEPAAVAAAKTRDAAPNPAGLELVKLAALLGIRIGPPDGTSVSEPDPLGEVGLAGLFAYLDGAFKQPDDRLGRAPAELRAWLVLQDVPARAVEKHLLAAGRDIVPAIPVVAWQDLQSIHARLKLAVDRSWSAAAAQLREELAYAASHLIRRLDDCAATRPSMESPASIFSAFDIYRDLDALHDEFDEVRIDQEAQTLTVVTDTIVLEDTVFGRFQIVLDWNQISDDQPYALIALDSNPASVDSAITHPHVRDEHLCEGNGRLSIRRALQQGRLCDFFLLVRQILDTYNADSAYVQLEHWHGSDCRDCGRSMGPDDSTSCERCDAEMCVDCSCSCPDCGVSCCSECRTMCMDCEMDLCTPCLKECPSCGGNICPKCLKAGLCLDCRKKENERDDKESDDNEVQATAGPAGEGAYQAQAPVQPVRLGEAVVSA